MIEPRSAALQSDALPLGQEGGERERERERERGPGGPGWPELTKKEFVVERSAGNARESKAADVFFNSITQPKKSKVQMSLLVQP